jgi:15-cis-phytoene synthase
MLNKGWEDHLIRHARVDPSESGPIQLQVHHLGESLETAYIYCSKLTAIHSKSFFMASNLLPPETRKSIRALYAFCRTTDDIIDVYTANGEVELQRWRERALTTIPQTNDPVSLAWAHTRHTLSIPTTYAKQLIDGVSQDIHVHRYESFSALTEYCYGVASTVGLMSMHIIGFTEPSATRYAIKLGVALQLTNILRDIAEDWERGRVYLPQDELHEYGITEKHFREGIVDDSWKSFMQFQIARARKIYDEAWPGISLLHPSGQLSIAAAATFYRGILDKIEENHYNVFISRAHLTKWGKIQLMPKLWYTYNLAPTMKLLTFGL